MITVLSSGRLKCPAASAVMWDVVTNVDVPVLVLAGDDDRVDPPATLAEHLLPRIPTATMELVTGTGHLAPLEVPDQVSGHVERFVAEVTP